MTYFFKGLCAFFLCFSLCSVVQAPRKKLGGKGVVVAAAVREPSIRVDWGVELLGPLNKLTDLYLWTRTSATPPVGFSSRDDAYEFVNDRMRVFVKNFKKLSFCADLRGVDVFLDKFAAEMKGRKVLAYDASRDWFKDICEILLALERACEAGEFIDGALTAKKSFKTFIEVVEARFEGVSGLYEENFWTGAGSLVGVVSTISPEDLAADPYKLYIRILSTILSAVVKQRIQFGLRTPADMKDVFVPLSALFNGLRVKAEGLGCDGCAALSSFEHLFAKEASVEPTARFNFFDLEKVFADVALRDCRTIQVFFIDFDAQLQKILTLRGFEEMDLSAEYSFFYLKFIAFVEVLKRMDIEGDSRQLYAVSGACSLAANAATLTFSKALRKSNMRFLSEDGRSFVVNYLFRAEAVPVPGVTLEAAAAEESLLREDAFEGAVKQRRAGALVSSEARLDGSAESRVRGFLPRVMRKLKKKDGWITLKHLGLSSHEFFVRGTVDFIEMDFRGLLFQLAEISTAAHALADRFPVFAEPCHALKVLISSVLKRTLFPSGAVVGDSAEALRCDIFNETFALSLSSVKIFEVLNGDLLGFIENPDISVFGIQKVVGK